MSDEQSLDTKVVVLGNTGVGKTSMVNWYTRGQFVSDVTATIGAAFTKKDLFINGWRVVLQIWDTAGQERFRSMAPMYYRGAHAAILVFDATNPDSLNTVDGWVEELQQNATQDIVLVLAMNKSDLRDDNPEVVIPHKDAQAYAKEIGAALYQTSAKTGQSINQLFEFVAKTLLEKEQAALKSGKRSLTRGMSGNGIDLNDDDYDDEFENLNKKKKGCC